MQYVLGLFWVFIMLPITLDAQVEFTIDQQDRENTTMDPVNPSQAPFYHGVASGDPLEDRVIIWTRVTPPTDQTITVDWEMAEDVDFTTIASSGQMMTDSSRDYTVKVDAAGLSAGTTYYYRFNALGETSVIGRTKTLESTNVSQIKLGVVSCNDYRDGYFVPLRGLAKRNDLDAVVHLGDFIYENGSAPGDTNRLHVPLGEVLDLGGYRTRYSHYRLDPDLQEAMRQHPFINIWDDHEVANNAWKDGAANHNPGEGNYMDRKLWAIQAFFEWVPIRDNPSNDIYRTMRFGDLLDLVLLDTRHLARSIQVDSFFDPNRFDPNREMLGPAQMSWFKGQLSDPGTTWKVIGNQVVFSPAFAENIEPLQPGVQDLFMDLWHGYPPKRDTIINYIETNSIDNVVFVTGDIHVSLGFDITNTPLDTLAYDPNTGLGSVAVELVTPSISSHNFDERIGTLSTQILTSLFEVGNPHNKYLDLSSHGYFVLDVTPGRAQGDFYLVDQVKIPNEIETFSGGLYTDVNTNFLNVTNTPAPPKPIQEAPAPPLATRTQDIMPDLLLLSAYPNPTSDWVTINYVLLEKGSMQIRLVDQRGRLVDELFERRLSKGNYVLRFNMAGLPNGVYFVQFETERGVEVRKLIMVSD